MKKLNLGCGSSVLDGYINVDKFSYYKPNLIHDLEIIPYPFDENSVDEIILSHVLEHIGQDPEIFNKIVKELYRICKNDTLIHIYVPHPNHNDFISDPTHVRPITVLGLQLYDESLNKKWQKNNASNTPLALINNVNFKIENTRYDLDPKYSKLLANKEITQEKLREYIEQYNNVVKQIYIQWKVIK